MCAFHLRSEMCKLMFSGTKRLIKFIVHSYMLELFELDCSGLLSDGGLTLLHVEQLRIVSLREK